MKKLIILIITVILMGLPFFQTIADANTNTKAKTKTKKNKVVKIEYETQDKFLISAKLVYPKTKEKIYPLVVLLHSIGENSEQWALLPDKLLESGFAVLKVDLRGHGESIYNIDLNKKYWQNLSLKAYAKYPNDIDGLLNYIQQEYKNISFSHCAIIGADIGANTAILASQLMKNKPFAIALISPQTKFKGLYIPIALADLPNTNILFVYSKLDNKTVKEVKSLKRFAQAEIKEQIYPAGGTGMVLIKNNKDADYDIVNWCADEFNKYIDKLKNQKQ